MKFVIFWLFCILGRFDMSYLHVILSLCRSVGNGNSRTRNQRLQVPVGGRPAYIPFQVFVYDPLTLFGPAPLNIFGLGRVRVPILFGDDLSMSDLPYTKGFMDAQNPPKKFLTFETFVRQRGV